MRIILIPAFCLAAFAQRAPDAIVNAMSDRGLAEQAMRLKTDERITFYSELVKAKPETPHYQVLLAGAYIQKMRETTDFQYIDRASKILDSVLAADIKNYEALRLRTQVNLERHNFKTVANDSLQLIKIAPADPWNWGTLGDSYIELGDYDKAADAYQKMMDLRPDLSSYNRAAHYRFLVNDTAGAIDIMKLAIDSGSSSPENVAWCLVELGNYYYKTNRLSEAEYAYTRALRTFGTYHPAFAALGKVQAARGDTKAAIESYKRAQAITPFPDYAAALFDLYTKAGQSKEAAQQRATIDAIDRLVKANNEKANRNLSLIYSDHDWNLPRALELAQAELEYRQDIYTYDALAWALYKNKRYDEAGKAMEKALRLGTPEPMFQEHGRKIAAAQKPGGQEQ